LSSLFSQRKKGGNGDVGKKSPAIGTFFDNPYRSVTECAIKPLNAKNCKRNILSLPVIEVLHSQHLTTGPLVLLPASRLIASLFYLAIAVL
jgi:hypothetical protein